MSRHLRAVPARGRPIPGLDRVHHGGGSLCSRLLDLGVRATVKPMVTAWALTPYLPWPYLAADQAGRLLRQVAGTSSEVVELPECRAHVVRNEEADSGRVVVYFQGGAFLVGGVHLHAQMLSRLAQRTGAAIVVPRFRKLPRHPISAAVEDGLAAYRYALEQGVAPEDVVFAGDSAGGCLVFMVALAAREEGLPLPAGLLAMSPLVELDPDDRAVRPGGCAMFNARAFQSLTWLERRAARRAGADGPSVSPSRGELADLPPTQIQISSAECLYEESERMAELLATAGVPVELHVWDHQVHVFQAAAGLIPEATEALEELTRFIDRHAPGAHARPVRHRAG